MGFGISVFLREAVRKSGTQKVTVKASTRRTKSGKVTTVQQHTATRKASGKPDAARSAKRHGFGEEPSARQFRDMEHKEFWLQFGLPKYMRRRLAEAYLASGSLGTVASKAMRKRIMTEFVDSKNTDVLDELRQYGLEPLHPDYIKQAGIKITFGHATIQAADDFPW